MTVSRDRAGSIPSDLRITFKAVNDLKPDLQNPRHHDSSQIKKIASSIKEFGFNVPILIDAEQTVVAGHGRLLACKILGINEVPTIQLEHLSPERRRAFMIADNRLSEIAVWNEDLLAECLRQLSLADLNFNLEVIGFDAAEIDLRVIGLNSPDEREPPTYLPANDRPPIAQPDDLWILGRHKIYCGDALQSASYRRLLGNSKAALVFTDPPYNVRVDGHASGLGETHHREFAMASGEMNDEQFTEFLTTVCERMVSHSSDGSIHFICMDWRHIDHLSAAGRKVYTEVKNICVWVKSTAGMGSLYRSQHEFIFVYKNGMASHQNNVQLGRFGRHRSNVWTYPGANAFGRCGEEGKLLSIHPTVKPTAMVADALMDCSRRGDIVLDPFLGSGTTVIAAERTGRCAFGIEFDPLYVDIAIRRWQAHTRSVARHAISGRVFDEISAERDNDRG